MVVDMEALALDARPVDDDYVRPRDRRPKSPPPSRAGGGRSRPERPPGAGTAPAPTPETPWRATPDARDRRRR